jgi:GNAT superfamily N-acetyltransferase
MTLKVVPLHSEHLEDAAALVNERYRALRREVASLPPQYEEPGTILPLLSDLAQRRPGVIAVDGGVLVGFLLGLAIPDFGGNRAAYSPEWANGASAEGSWEIYRLMYAHLSARWVADGCLTHLVTLLAHDAEGIRAWQWMEFGLVSVDAMRDLTPLPKVTRDFTIRRAQLADLDQVMKLTDSLWAHLSSPPICVPPSEESTREYQEQWLANPDNVLWLARDGAEDLACMGLGPADPSACHIIRDDRTTSIYTAFTLESLRERGLATALLSHSVEWGRASGYQRCSVDFEPHNIPGARFWLRHFQPICYSLIRRIDAGIRADIAD